MAQNCDTNHINIEDKLDDSRLNNLAARFQKIVGSDPDYLIVSPGRVNIIGDHVDYHGFDVLPMAIEKSILFACRFSDDSRNQVRLHNTESDRHPSWTGIHSLRYGASLHKTHEWQNYILCGYHGVLAEQMLRVDASDVYKHSQGLLKDPEELEKVDSSLRSLKSIDIVVESDLPEASGLSSSSALVCASALATLLLLHHSQVNGRRAQSKPMIDRRKLAESCAKYEHLIGTQGGGMDQAVILTAQKGYAKHIQFTPKLRCTDVRLPDNIVWFVAHSGVRCPKAASHGFNSRVLETKLGAAMIEKSLCSSPSDDNCPLTLGQIRDKYLAGKPIAEIINLLREKVFKGKDTFTIDEVCSNLDISRDHLVSRFNTTDEFVSSILNNNVRLSSRCEHVFEEAHRVEQFRLGCTEGADSVVLGKLMSESHNSLLKKYECSHSSLDKIAERALDAGAAGARLTGAGWGGCVIVMTTVENSSTVAEKLGETCEFLFQSEPQTGCRIISFTNKH